MYSFQRLPKSVCCIFQSIACAFRLMLTFKTRAYLFSEARFLLSGSKDGVILDSRGPPFWSSTNIFTVLRAVTSNYIDQGTTFRMNTYNCFHACLREIYLFACIFYIASFMQTCIFHALHEQFIDSLFYLVSVHLVQPSQKLSRRWRLKKFLNRLCRWCQRFGKKQFFYFMNEKYFMNARTLLYSAQAMHGRLFNLLQAMRTYIHS